MKRLHGYKKLHDHQDSLEYLRRSRLQFWSSLSCNSTKFERAPHACQLSLSWYSPGRFLSQRKVTRHGWLWPWAALLLEGRIWPCLPSQICCELDLPVASHLLVCTGCRWSCWVTTFEFHEGSGTNLQIWGGFAYSGMSWAYAFMVAGIRHQALLKKAIMINIGLLAN
jgi:hypothetical protein